ncbi:hypothetical protein KR009_011100 [Drosophila setifemur]|nr:hypothetical protein KR009_011100 [Drosophila setifemur]
MSNAWGSFVVVLLFLGQCTSDVFEECNGVDGLNFVDSPKSCAHFIYCDGDDSYDGECEDGEYFSSELQLCEPMGDIDCRTGLAMPDSTPAPESASSSSMENSSEAAEVGNSTANFTNPNTTLGPTSVVVTTRPSVIETGTTNSNSNSTGGPSSIEVIVTTHCPQLDNQSRIVLKPNLNSCSDYYICYRGESLPMNCAASLHFNSRTGKCDHPENVRCLAMTSNPREQCKRHTIDVYPHADNCNYFYQCRMGFLIVQQCPFFYGWDYEKRACVALAHAKCFNRIQMPMKLK